MIPRGYIVASRRERVRADWAVDKTEFEGSMKLENRLFFEQVDTLLSDSRRVTLKVRGNSMNPWLWDGRHSVVVRRHTEEDVHRGEVLFFVSDGRWIMHRLERVEGDVLTFAGDGNYRLKECVRKEDVRGVVESVVTPSGRVIRCDGWEWRVKSRLWLVLPAIVRRYVLAVVRRIKL